MPWTPRSFSSKHNHSLGPEEAAKAASIANAVLRKTGSDAEAIRIGNWQAKHMKRKTTIGEMMRKGN